MNRCGACGVGRHDGRTNESLQTFLSGKPVGRRIAGVPSNQRNQSSPAIDSDLVVRAESRRWIEALHVMQNVVARETSRRGSRGSRRQIRINVQNQSGQG